MEGRTLPSNVDYSKVLPLAVESRSRRRSFFPVNGQSFSSNGNNIIRIDISADSFLDTKHSYLRFKYTNNSAAAAIGFDYGGGHGLIRRLRIEQAGSVLSDCNHYNKLMSAIILPAQGGLESVAHRSLTEGLAFASAAGNGNTMNPAPAAEVSGASLGSQNQTNGQVAAGDSYTFSIPLMNGLLGTTQDKMVPLQLLGSQPITIEIELADLLDIGAYTAAPAVGEDYTISDVRYIASLVEVGPEVDAQLRMVQEMSGGRLVMNGVDYTHFNGNIPANALGNQVINVPARRKSLKSLFFVGASESYVAAGAGPAGEHALSDNLSFGGHFNMVDYQLKIGSVLYPPTPVDCEFQGGAAITGLVRGEAASELAKCMGTLGSVAGLGNLSTINYATTDCLVANIPRPAAAGAAVTTPRFAPFAMDLESFQRTAIELISGSCEGFNSFASPINNTPIACC